jgi:hypothetical protein
VKLPSKKGLIIGTAVLVLLIGVAAFFTFHKSEAQLMQIQAGYTAGFLGAAKIRQAYGGKLTYDQEKEIDEMGEKNGYEPYKEGIHDGKRGYLSMYNFVTSSDYYKFKEDHSDLVK